MTITRIAMKLDEHEISVLCHALRECENRCGAASDRDTLRAMRAVLAHLSAGGVWLEMQEGVG